MLNLCLLGALGNERSINVASTISQLLGYYLHSLAHLSRRLMGELIAGFTQALENLENHSKKFHAWKNHGI